MKKRQLGEMILQSPGQLSNPRVSYVESPIPFHSMVTSVLDDTTSVHEKKEDEMNRLEDGAIRSGGMPNLFCRENIGLLLNYVSVGIVYGAFPKTIYPFLGYYLNMDGY
jgi:hypothetical protein